MRSISFGQRRINPMCGRYVLNAPEDLSERFQLRQLTINLPRTYNAAPSQMLPIIVRMTASARPN